MNIGLDILEFKDFPSFSTGREQRFFHDNFTKIEINHIVNNKDVDKEFGRIFSIKESLVKVDKSLLNINFNKINTIKNGAISYKDYLISSSIINNLCISTVMTLNI